MRRAGVFGGAAGIFAFALWAPAVLLAQELPLGDGHVTDHPAVGNVYSCQAVFRGGGARHEGPWFHGTTWNPLEKPHVGGRVLWPEATLTLTLHGAEVEVQGNGLPIDEPTGTFPISPADPVYQYDTNPNHIAAQHLTFEIPAAPAIASAPSCLPMGMIGFTLSGVALYNALDDAGRDAAAHEIQDNCDGHPQANAQYHYHNASPCIPGVASDSLVGWSLDGMPIYGMANPDGSRVTNADLDACHGRLEKHLIAGRQYAYAYRLTREYPYTLGCYVGTVPDGTRAAIRGGLEPGRRGGGGRGGRGGRGAGGGRGGGGAEAAERPTGS